MAPGPAYWPVEPVLPGQLPTPCGVTRGMKALFGLWTHLVPGEGEGTAPLPSDSRAAAMQSTWSLSLSGMLFPVSTCGVGPMTSALATLDLRTGVPTAGIKSLTLPLTCSTAPGSLAFCARSTTVLFTLSTAVAGIYGRPGMSRLTLAPSGSNVELATVCPGSSTRRTMGQTWNG